MTTFNSINVREKLNNITECSVCAETYSDPRVLPCIHTYCLKCIKRFSDNKHPGDCVSCPLCRKDFIVPEHGIDSLPKNFFVEQLKDLTQTSSILCEGCDDTSGKKQATMYCIECQEKFCEACVRAHRRMRLLRDHTLTEIGDDGKVPEVVGKMLTLHCNKHLNETLKLYCFDCNEVICFTCFSTSHQSHECSEIDKVSQDFRSQMTGDIQNMGKTAKYCRDMIKEQEKNGDDLNNVVSGIEKQICDMAERMKKMIDSEKSKLLQQLSTCKTNRMKQVQHVIENIEQHAQFADSLAEYTEELRSKGTASAVAQQITALHDRADELMKLDHIQLEINGLGSIEVTFEAAKIPIETTGQLLGTIKWQQQVNGNYRIVIADCNVYFNACHVTPALNLAKYIAKCTQICHRKLE
jgi:hypothetical protein